MRTDIQDWRISFVDTGLHASVGERLMAVRRHLEDEELFLANYADVLTDARMDLARGGFPDARGRRPGSCRSGRDTRSTSSKARSMAASRASATSTNSDLWINGGHFILRPSVFDYMQPGDELVERPFERMIEAGQLITYRHDGFWAPMDTLKDMQDARSAVRARGSPVDPLALGPGASLMSGGGPMRGLSRWADGRPFELLLIGAHPDDIEIGCGGTVLRWAREGRIARATWLVLSGDGRSCARRPGRSAAAFLAWRARGTSRSGRTVPGRLLPVRRAPDSRTSSRRSSRSVAPDLILTHDRDRPPSGSPACRRADLADVSRPPGP